MLALKAGAQAIGIINHKSGSLKSYSKRYICSYDRWINKLESVDKLSTMHMYESANSKWTDSDEYIIDNEIQSWCNKFELMSKKITKAKIAQLSIATAPYLSINEVIEYSKLASWLYCMDDVLFDNFNISIHNKISIVDNMMNGLNNHNFSDLDKIINLTYMYNELLLSPNICNKPIVIEEIYNYAQYSLKECEMNDGNSIIHYNQYLKDRRYTAGAIVCAKFLSNLIDKSNENDLYLLHLYSDIIILINDLIGYDREQANGEIITYPGLLKFHDNIPDDHAEQITYNLLISKINEFQTYSNNISQQCSQQFMICNAWIIGYYLHEKNCNRQQKASTKLHIDEHVQ